MTTSRRPNERAMRKADKSRQGSSRPKTTRVRDADVDGGLTLLDTAGGVIHVAPPAVTESLRYMLARLRLSESGELPERFGLTSAIGGEGVTFLCRSLALVLANDTGRRVCVVDLNWWAPPGPFGHEANASGVAQVIQGTVPLANALIATGNPQLAILPAGPSAVSERPLLVHSPELEKILVELSESYDHVIIDLPAVHATSESLTLAEISGVVAMVVSYGVTPEAQVKDALERLNGVTVLGTILNRSSSKIPRIIRRRLVGV